MKSRFLKDTISDKNNKPFSRIIVLTGARQTGKTTLARHCFPGYSYLSIEDPVLRMHYKKFTAGQWKEHYPEAILDEIQKEPVLIESIKSVYDQYGDVRYVLLGSSQLLLLSKVKESLAGRCVIEEVLPLTLPEMLTGSWDEKPKISFYQHFLNHLKLPELLPSFELYPDYAKKLKVFEYYLVNGGYPALVDESFSDDQRFEWLKGYVRTYLERDVRDLADFRSLEPFVKVQRMTAMLTAKLINFSQLGNEASVSSKTAQRFLQYLELSYQTIMLQPWHSNNLKRLVKSPKLHYLDPGVQRAILQKRGELTGNEFESAIVAEIYKQTKVIGIDGLFYHLRTHDGAEVDLLLELEPGFIAFEIKKSNKIGKKDARHLLNLHTILNKPVIQSFILSNDNEVKIISDKVLAVPSALFLT
jgi:predicted AAA+ superfamily ATPase